MMIFSQENIQSMQLPGAYIGNATTKPTDSNPFIVTPASPSVVNRVYNGLPSILVSTDNSTSFNNWVIDFQSSASVVWADNCTQNLINNFSRPCSLYPTLVANTFSTLTYKNYTDPSIGFFNGLTFSGYTTNGFIVLN